MDNTDLNQRDLNVLWHPCAQVKHHEWLPRLPIRHGKGVWLEGFDDNRYTDRISSRGVNLRGLANQTPLHPLGNLMCGMPPYVVNPEEIAHTGWLAAEDIDLTTRD